MRSWQGRLLVAVVAVQLVVLYAPRAPSTGGVPGLDKLVHVLLFALVTAVGLRAPVPRWLVLVLTVVHAPVSELVQARLLPGRSGDPLDLLADLTGCALGWWVLRRPAPQRS